MNLDLTPKALDEVRKLRRKEYEKAVLKSENHLESNSVDSNSAESGSKITNENQVRLRVMVVGGGCSGMSYKLAFEKNPPTDKDKVLEFDDVQVLVDVKSGLFLDGIQIDFSDGLEGTGFNFNNPKAKRTCGCGSSFSV